MYIQILHVFLKAKSRNYVSMLFALILLLGETHVNDIL